MSSKRKSVSIEEKYHVIQRIADTKCTQQQIAEELGIPRCTVTRWATVERQKIVEHYEGRMVSSSRKRMRTSKYATIDQTLYAWFRDRCANHLATNGPALTQMAHEVAQQLNQSDFKASNGWLDRWKKRYNISFRQHASGHETLVFESSIKEGDNEHNTDNDDRGHNEDDNHDEKQEEESGVETDVNNERERTGVVEQHSRVFDEHETLAAHSIAAATQLLKPTKQQVDDAFDVIRAYLECQSTTADNSELLYQLLTLEHAVDSLEEENNAYDATRQHF